MGLSHEPKRLRRNIWPLYGLDRNGLVRSLKQGHDEYQWVEPETSKQSFLYTNLFVCRLTQTLSRVYKALMSLMKFSLRTLLVLTLFIASFLFGWVSHRQSVRNRLQELQRLQFEIIELNRRLIDNQQQIKLDRSQPPSDLIYSLLKEQERLELLLQTTLDHSKQCVNKLSAD